MSQYESANDGYRYIYTMIDSFSKFAWAAPALRKDGTTCAKILKKHFYNEGKWDKFHSDNGGEFVNSHVEEVLRSFTMQEVHGRPYHPQSQGQIERFNRTLKSRIRRTVDPQNFRWLDIIDDVVYLYNNTTHRATKLKPILLFRGYDPDIHEGTYVDTNEFRSMPE